MRVNNFCPWGVASAALLLTPVSALHVPSPIKGLPSSSPLFSSRPTSAKSTTALSVSTWHEMELLGEGCIASAQALAGAVEPILDMNRVKIRLEGLSSYGVIASLMMNAVLRLYSATPKRLDTNQSPQTSLAKIVFLITVTLATLCGSYTTVVFSLLGLYSKTALGLGRDERFLQFFDATQEYRATAFRCFLISLVSFQLSFVCSLYLNYDKKLRVPAFALGMILAVACAANWSNLIAVATRILFSH